MWNLTDAPNAAVFTTRQVAEREIPCLVVIHDDDGDWQALGPGPRAPEDSVLIDLADLLGLDPRIEVAVRHLDDLGRGWKAQWNGDTWQYEEFRLPD